MDQHVQARLTKVLDAEGLDALVATTPENLQYVTTVLVGGDDQNPFLQHTPHLIIVKLDPGAAGKITLVGTQGSVTYKKEFISKKCVPKDKDK